MRLMDPDKIKDRRQELGLSQQRLAELTGLSIRTIWRIEHKELPKMGTIDTLRRITEVLGEEGKCPFCGSEDEEQVERAQTAVEELQDLYYDGHALVLLGPDGSILHKWEDVQEWDLVDHPTKLAMWLYRNEIGRV